MPRREGIPESVVEADSIEELERALTRVAHLLTRARRHGRTVAAAGVTLDRANVPLLRMLADSEEPMRLGELAACLGVEAPHVTRQIQRLERERYVDRVPDPDDRRAQRVRITDEGRATVEAIRTVSRRNMQEALAEWTTEDLQLLSTLSHRMVDDFLTNADRNEALDGR